ncbi:hypothetical protein ABB37_06021 [Leptomonas pyrrhocoris]|uniref:Uncharacterized protein n=1 Tax=Leptomonas pyrrhocoris TaxID=157538 RepID=A0A0M9FZ87_LEPPY|nr:hypothetical protein ABB37_06021 [Leptomonas pyrrhocoris]KPA78957.1 hypothetical protein ABB37_06021 [Leptomonas pyrrhocoris]|eukprot:XP_015657396.1 hypothetical protein ABB37_06021 [Leptomonas pyrrhocoris]
MSPTAAAVLQEEYEAARRAIVKGLGAYPFSYARVLGRQTTPADEWRLRGLSNGDFVLATEAREGGTHELRGKDAKQPPMTAHRTAAVRAPDAQSSASSVSLPMQAKPPRWPSLLQLTREIERHTMTRTYLWEISPVKKTATASSNSLFTTSDAYAATPSLLAFYTVSVLSRIAEHAVRHAWRGGPHLYPKRRVPERNSAFAFSGCPRLTLEDVTSQQWDRAEAAHFLISVLQHSCIQQDLRQRLWTAAQCYHRDILQDLDSLARGTRQEGGRKSFIAVDDSRAASTAFQVPLEEVKRQLFAFPAHIHFSVVPSADVFAGAAGNKGKVVVQPLRSSHWFHFSSSDRDVMRIFSERPHTDIFMPSKAFTEVTKMANQGAPMHKTRTTQDQLWLLLSEMSRLRILVGYLLHLEAFLYKMRCAAEVSPGEHTASDGKGVTRQGLSTADAQAAHDARYVGEVFHFLEIQLHMQLQRRHHSLRFLSKHKIQYAASEAAEDSNGSPATFGEDDVASNGASTSGSRLQEEARCFSTVQGLFTAFIRALEGDPRHTLPEKGGAPAQVETAEKKAPDIGSGELQGGGLHATRVNPRKSVDQRANSTGKTTHLSADDEAFLQAVVSSLPSETRHAAKNRGSSQWRHKTPERKTR